jgi:hypothetical protein
MRVYGRTTNPDGSKKWVVVQTDPDTGSNSWVYLTALCQALLLFLNESPFYSQFGIPAQQSVQMQVAPDLYVSRIQQFFAQFFASLILTKDPAARAPTYNIRATTLEGTPVSVTVQVPE